jgi:hypothetical protein
MKRAHFGRRISSIVTIPNGIFLVRVLGAEENELLKVELIRKIFTLIEGKIIQFNTVIRIQTIRCFHKTEL